MSQLDKPNLVIPLASSYDQRGINGLEILADSLDQRKINCMYQVIDNSLTGKRTIKLVKRPGLQAAASVSGPSSLSDQYLLCLKPNLVLSDDPGTSWVFYALAAGGETDIYVADSSGNTKIYDDDVGGAAPYYPRWVSLTSVSGTDYAVLQLQQTAGVQKVFFASARNSWTEITDADFTGLSEVGQMAFKDGYAFVISSDTNRIHQSDANSLSAWTSGQYITRSFTQDPGAGLAQLGQQIIGFGTETMEAFYNAGNASGSVLSKIPQLAFRIGLPNLNYIDRHYYCTSGALMYFLGHQPGTPTEIGVFAYNGSSHPEKVSPPAVDACLSSVGTNYGTLASGVSIWATSIRGQPAISVSAIGATESKWFMFFPKLNAWFEWTSDYYQPVTNGYYFLGKDASDACARLGAVEYGTDSWADEGATLTTNPTTTVQFKLPSDGNYRKRMPVCGVIGDTARSASTLGVEFSDDDGQTWSTARNIDMTQVAKKHLYRCGAYTDRWVRLTHTGNVELRLDKFLARIDD